MNIRFVNPILNVALLNCTQFIFSLYLLPQTNVMDDPLHLKNQVCFPVYNLSREITNRYRPFLDELGLTYPQYLVLMGFVGKTNRNA